MRWLPAWVGKMMAGREANEVASPAPTPAPVAPGRTPLPQGKLRASLYHAPIHPVSSADVLLGELPRWRESRDILYRFSQVPEDFFEATYLAAIRAFAERVQWLPASPNYHHYEPLGQLEHTLETVLNVLAERRALILPLGAEPERESRERTVWTYAAFCAALGHDVGRPAARFRMRALIKGQWRPYSPMGQSLLEIGATEYQATWDDRMPYEFHHHLSPIMFGLFMPKTGLAWLNTCPEALGQMSAYLGGHKYHCGVLGEIAHRADGRSVANYQGIRAPGGTPLSGAVATPLHERAVGALRALSGEWIINHRTPEGTPMGRSDAWVRGHYIFVRATVMEDLHQRLVREDPKGVPASSDIITRLQDVGHCLSANASARGQAKAIFTIRLVDAEGNVTFDKFTVLIFPLDVLFEVGQLPGQWDGEITIVSPKLPLNHMLMIEQLARSAAPEPKRPAENTSVPAGTVGLGTSNSMPMAHNGEPSPPGTVAPAPAQPAESSRLKPQDDAINPPAADDVAAQESADAAGTLAQLLGLTPPAKTHASAPTVVGEDRSIEEEYPASASADDAVMSEPAGRVAATSPQRAAPVGPPTPQRSAVATNLDRLNEFGDFVPAAHRECDPPAVRAFFAWLREGLTPDADKKSRISINNKHALIHGVAAIADGLGIISPRAFEQFERTSGYVYTEEDATVARKPNLHGCAAASEHLSFQLVFRKSKYAIYNGEKTDQNVFSYSPPPKEGKVGKALSLAIVGNGAIDLIFPEGLAWAPNPVLTRVTSEPHGESVGATTADGTDATRSTREASRAALPAQDDAPEKQKRKRAPVSMPQLGTTNPWGDDA